MQIDGKDISIRKLGLSEYLIKKLGSVDIFTVKDLINLSVDDLSRIGGLKKQSIDTIVNKVQILGLEFSSVDKLKKEIILDSTIYDLNFKPRICNALVRSGVKTVKDLISLKHNDLQEIKNIGSLAIGEIIDVVNSLNLEFEEKDINLDSSIYILDVDFSIRVKLARNGIKTIGELIKLEIKDLLEWIHPYYSKKIVDEIHSLGFKFDNEIKVVEKSDDKDNNYINKQKEKVLSVLNTYYNLLLEYQAFSNESQVLDYKIEKIMLDILEKTNGDKYAKIKK